MIRNDKARDALREFSQRLKQPVQTRNILAMPDIVQWVQRYFYVYDTENILNLHPSQSAPMREATRKTNEGKYVYSLVIWSWIKKSAKSTIIAAVCDYVACNVPKAAIRLVANDRKQADSRVGFYMRENIKIGETKGYAIDIDDKMRDFRQHTKISSSNYRIEYPNGSVIEMVPIDPRGEAGGNDDLVVFSELWGWKHQSHIDMWSEMTISSTRYGQAQQWIDTYAGFENDSPVLEPLYKQVVKPENNLNIPENAECYAVGDTFATWVTKPLLPWQSKEYYAGEARRLTPDQFKRLHQNGWTTSEDAFVPLTWWDACIDEHLPRLTPYDEMIVSIDAGIVDDGFGIIAVSRDRRKNHILETDDEPHILIVRYANVWYPSKDKPLKFDGYEGSPADELRKLAAQFNVVQFCYDKWQMEHFVNELNAEGLGWFEPFSQASEREVGDKMLYDMIRQRRILHGGKSHELRNHIANANRQILSDRKMRIVKRSHELKIDLTVALAMGCKRGVEWIPM